MEEVKVNHRRSWHIAKHEVPNYKHYVTRTTIGYLFQAIQSYDLISFQR
ncbi:hypothetical protein G4V62_16830 [Bacillaceae bacterium SIJ1]|nr:hypothetical protein [Litoribacterium kuwaitense]NGP46530.1 hypothetical protein [Litoribacterium kuwaitense]